MSESRIFEKATAIEYVLDQDVMKLLDYKFYFNQEKIPDLPVCQRYFNSYNWRILSINEMMVRGIF